MTDTTACPTCRIVSRVTWGPFKVANWKRPALRILSVLVILGSFALAAWAVTNEADSWIWLLIAPVSGLAILGFVVSLRGCIDCVSRVFGGI